ncbi:hypothetical protein MLD52_21635 [Puniceicoccaceae bacterium K14]|nr:hypothetical protein [Puniceicoccaceae bacterium K14]
MKEQKETNIMIRASFALVCSFRFIPEKIMFAAMNDSKINGTANTMKLLNGIDRVLSELAIPRMIVARRKTIKQ